MKISTAYFHPRFPAYTQKVTTVSETSLRDHTQYDNESLQRALVFRADLRACICDNIAARWAWLSMKSLSVPILKQDLLISGKFLDMADSFVKEVTSHFVDSARTSYSQNSGCNLSDRPLSFKHFNASCHDIQCSVETRDEERVWRDPGCQNTIYVAIFLTVA